MKKYLPIFVAIFFSILALYFRIERLAYHSFNVDELMQLFIINRPFLDFLKMLTTNEFCSFLSGDYYLIYPFFKVFQYNKWGLAVPHIIATILGFYLLYLICRLYYKTIWGYIITFAIVCFNATLILHATEIRTYAVLPTLALAAFYFSQLLIAQPFINLKKKWLIGAFFVLIIWFHVYGILILLLSFIYSLLTKLHTKFFKDTFKSNIKFMSVVLSVAMPLWLYSIFGSHFSYQGLRSEIMFAHIPNPLVDIIAFFKAIFGNLMGYKKLYPLFLGIIIPLIIPYKDRYKHIALLLIMVFLPIILILLSDLRTQYYFLQKQFIWTMPFFALFIGLAWESFLVYIYERFK
ncbi:MAG: hypothetical protein Q8O13_06840 [Candidatus Omnitrophota bacterium]|nr:hypothetical protein [Candidatus Omnitrophota bacterium]